MTESQAVVAAKGAYLYLNLVSLGNTKISYEEFRSRFFNSLADKGYTIYADDFSKVVQPASKGSPTRQNALVILGGDDENPNLFYKASSNYVSELKKSGFDVNILSYSKKDYGLKNVEGNQQRIENAFDILNEIHALGIFSHHLAELNFTDKFELSQNEQVDLFSKGNYAIVAKKVGILPVLLGIKVLLGKL